MRIMIVVISILLYGLVSATSTPSTRPVRCGIHNWADERPRFKYCEVVNVPLTKQYKDKTIEFLNGDSGVSAVKFIAASKVEYIPEEMVTIFPKLRGFVLESSNIPILKEQLFGSTFKKLKFLEIQHNNLKVVEKNALKNLDKLEWIRLASNKIQTLDETIFTHNVNLQYVDFRNNRIKKVNPQLFAGLESLDQVLFSIGNVCIQEDFQDIENIQEVLTEKLSSCSNEDEKVEEEDPNKIKVDCKFPTWTDERLTFSYCVTDETDLSLSNKGKEFIFTGEEIEKNAASAVKFKDASKIAFIPEEIIVEFPNFNSLILDQSELPVIKETLLTPKFKKMKFLEILNCDTKEIEEKAFQHLPNLEWIRILPGKVEKLDSNIFKINKKLKYIDFRENNIKMIIPDLFVGLSQLQQVLLSGENHCVSGNYKKSDTSLYTMRDALKPCFDNCLQDKKCSKSIVKKSNCGQRKSESSQDGKFPWIAALYHNGKYICGGNLISKKHVLTAAQCIKDKSETEEKTPGDSYIILGTSDLNDTQSHVIKAEIQEFIVHPDWDHSKTEYEGDVAIAVLKKEVKFSDFIQPVCINSQDNHVESYVGNSGTYVGWAPADSNFDDLGPIRESSIPIISTVKCLTSSPLFFNILSHNTTFCAGKRDGVSGPCKGDSGTGLYMSENGQWTLFGTVSAALYKEGKCDLRNYAVFSDVGKYEKFINQVLSA